MPDRQSKNQVLPKEKRMERVEGTKPSRQRRYNETEIGDPSPLMGYETLQTHGSQRESRGQRGGRKKQIPGHTNLSKKIERKGRIKPLDGGRESLETTPSLTSIT